MASSIAQEAAKRRIALRYWLLGKGYHRAALALDFNEALFPGKRKDGVTPAFDHHISQASYLRTMCDGLLFPEATLSTTCFHDSLEDADLSPQEIVALYADDKPFGQQVADATWRVTKKWRGVTRDEAALFDEMSRCPIASVVKGADRIHNVQSMVGVFTQIKQRAYLEEVDRLFLPMLKQASRRFPQQEPVYSNIRLMLRAQSALVRAALDGTMVPAGIESKGG